jgi:glycosyltransferase involved in cell wall biosynthesis
MKNMKYKLMARYTTGDSFSSEETTDEILELSNLEIMDENLTRLKMHYMWYRSKNNSGYKKYPKPSFVVDDPTMYTGDRVVLLKDDNGNEFQMSLPYCGYFETLHKLYVETSMGIDFRNQPFKEVYDV